MTVPMTPRTRWSILAFALVGLAFASASAWVHYRLLTDPTYVSPCDINAPFNCSQVYLSRFGSVRGRAGGAGRRVLVRAGRAHRGLRQAAPKEQSSRGRRATSLRSSTIGLAVVLYLGTRRSSS